MSDLDSRSTKKSTELTLVDKLSRLSYSQTLKLLGNDAQRLLRSGNKWDFRMPEDVYLGEDMFRLKFPLTAGEMDSPPVVTIRLAPESYDRLHWSCARCQSLCVHVGAAFSLILDEKMALGLSSPPPERVPVESLKEDELLKSAIEERWERARVERMTVQSADPARPWTDYTVISKFSGKTYRVAVRGRQPGESYCSCPDFRTNTLGVCKHILHVLAKLKRRFTVAQLKEPYKRKAIGVHIQYRDTAALRLLLPDKLDPETAKVLSELRGRDIDDVSDLLKRIQHLGRLGRTIHIYPDAEEFIQQRLLLDRIALRAAEIRRKPESHPLRRELLKAELLPYQLDGIAFAAGAGRAVLADDMGLGKTIQAIGVAEFLAREAGIAKVLVVCPASVKSQWRHEIERFCARDCQLISGSTASRGSQYASNCFFTVCNYEQVLRDILSIERVNWGSDHPGRRPAHQELGSEDQPRNQGASFAVRARVVGDPARKPARRPVFDRSIHRRSPTRPGISFLQPSSRCGRKGQGAWIQEPVRVAREPPARAAAPHAPVVRQQLPMRTNEIVRITPAEEQLDMHGAHMRLVKQITEKPFLTEMDLLRLQKHLLMCRMSADSTFLVDKHAPGYSSKLEELDELFDRLFSEDGRKVLLFSEWTTMLNLIEPLLKKRRLSFVRLDGSVPQKLRQGLVHEFQTNPHCRLFLTTNAGSTGLNLQAANTVINVDLPWNPAVLEQRIARAYRMGQKQPVQVFILITEGTIEEKLLSTLSAKHDLALAALDAASDVDQVKLEGGMEELRRRLEVLLGARPEAPLDESLRRETEAAAARREKLAVTGGQLLSAAFQFLGELLPAPPASEASTAANTALAATLKQSLTGLVDKDDHGRPRLTFALPDSAALDNLTHVLARLLTQTQPRAD